jgi:hypothetical protein
VAIRFSTDNQEYSRSLGLGSTSQWSMCCWAKISSDRNTFSTIWDLSNANVFVPEYYVLETQSDGTTMTISTNTTVLKTRALTVGTWYFFGVSVNGVNGTWVTRAIDETSFTVETWSTGLTLDIQQLLIGESLVGGEWLNGAVEAFKFWTGATLTADEMIQEAFTIRPRRTENLRGWWPLLGTGSSNLDLSGNGQDLTTGSGGNSGEHGPGITWGTPATPVITQPSLSATATPGAIAPTATVPAPTISAGATVIPDPIAALADTPAPTVSGGATATPATVAAVTTVEAPVIITGGNVTLVPDTIAAVATVPEPTIARGTSVTPATVAAVSTVLAPTVIVPIGVTVTPDPVAAVAAVLPPVLDLPLLPGAFITMDGQLEYNGFLLGGGTPYGLVSLTGWDDTPGIDNGNTPRPARHGAWAGRKLGQERYITFTGLIKGPKATFADYVDAFVEGTPISEDEEELPLAIRTLSGVTRLVYGHVINRSLPLDKEYRQGLGRIAVQWVCADPRRYGIDIQSADLARGTTIQVTNIGNTPTHPTLRINGPATDPAVTIIQSGRKLAFDVALSAGQYIDIDCNKGTALLNGVTSVLAGRTSDSVPPQLFVFPSGASSVSYTATGATVPVADVLWRDAWM